MEAPEGSLTNPEIVPRSDCPDTIPHTIRPKKKEKTTLRQAFIKVSSVESDFRFVFRVVGKGEIGDADTHSVQWVNLPSSGRWSGHFPDTWQLLSSRFLAQRDANLQSGNRLIKNYFSARCVDERYREIHRAITNSLRVGYTLLASRESRTSKKSSTILRSRCSRAYFRRRDRDQCNADSNEDSRRGQKSRAFVRVLESHGPHNGGVSKTRPCREGNQTAIRRRIPHR